MTHTDITFEVPVRARARKHVGAKWREGWAVRPVVCSLTDVDPDPARNVTWGGMAFRSDGDGLYVRTTNAMDAPLRKQMQFWCMGDRVEQRGYRVPVVDRTLAFTLTKRQETSFGTLTGYVPHTVDDLASKASDGEYEVDVDEIDVDAVRTIYETELALAGNDVLFRVEAPHVVLCASGHSGIEAVPSTLFDVGEQKAVEFGENLSLPQGPTNRRILARFPVSDDLDWDALVPHLDGHPNDLRRDVTAFRSDGGEVVLPDADARRWIARSLGERMAWFSDGSVRTFLDERPALEGVERTAGTAALERILDAWGDEDLGFGASQRHAKMTGVLRALDTVLAPRLRSDAVMDVIEPFAPTP